MWAQEPVLECGQTVIVRSGQTYIYRDMPVTTGE
jgi:hypothetical protein